MGYFENGKKNQIGIPNVPQVEVFSAVNALVGIICSVPFSSQDACENYMSSSSQQSLLLGEFYVQFLLAVNALVPDIPQMAGMSIEKSESLNFYNYLCQKIGSEEVVKIRRLESTIKDIGDGKVTSGSKGEGLNFKSSDLDLMYVDTFPKVYQSQEEVVHDKRTTHFNFEY
ncbi:Hypothetical predicted protein [Mytilus galloprovincialis]|uniref:Uncharacterized protein n=1 Tax=Mytilus galloprovincialis TaxID=29158 RepID=A0A8B6H0R4_MYTGA|nr:Hypothetical predicted protein [Mytilus galloprovincialis]